MIPTVTLWSSSCPFCLEEAKIERTFMKLTCLRPHSLWVVKMGFETRSDYNVNIFSALLCGPSPHLLNFQTYRRGDSTLQWTTIYAYHLDGTHFAVFVLSSLCPSIHPLTHLIPDVFKVSCSHHYSPPLSTSACTPLIRIQYLFIIPFFEVNFTYREVQKS